MIDRTSEGLHIVFQDIEYHKKSLTDELTWLEDQQRGICRKGPSSRTEVGRAAMFASRARMVRDT